MNKKLESKIIDAYKSGKYKNNPQFTEDLNTLIDAGEIDRSLLESPQEKFTEEQINLIPELAGTVRNEAMGEMSDTTEEGIKKALNVASKITPYAGMAFNYSPAGIARSAALTGGSRFVEGITGDESVTEALKNAAIAGIIDSSIGKAGKFAGDLVQSKPVSNALGQVGEFFSSVPQKSVTKAIQNPQILKKTEDFKDVGVSAKGAMSDLMRDVGRKGQFQRRLLRGSDIKTDLGVYVDRQKKLLTRKEGSQPVYNAKEKKEINTYLNAIKKEDDPAGLNQIIKRIDEVTNYNYKDKRPEVVESKLKEIRNRLSSTLKRKFKDYDASRAEQQNILGGVRKKIGKKLDKDPSALFKRKQSEEVQEGLEELDRLVPDARLLDRAENIRIQDQFSRFAPGQGGGSGSGQGAANLLRMFGVGRATEIGTALGGPVGGGIAAALSSAAQSPLLNREVIKRTPIIPKALAKLLARQQTPLQPEPDGSISKDTVLRNRGGN